jgi:hypothetical protein
MHGGNELEPSNCAVEGTMNQANTSFSAEICDGAMISVVQYLAPLWQLRRLEGLKHPQCSGILWIMTMLPLPCK